MSFITEKPPKVCPDCKEFESFIEDGCYYTCGHCGYRVQKSDTAFIQGITPETEEGQEALRKKLGLD